MPEPEQGSTAPAPMTQEPLFHPTMTFLWPLTTPCEHAYTPRLNDVYAQLDRGGQALSPLWTVSPESPDASSKLLSRDLELTISLLYLYILLLSLFFELWRQG